MCAAWSGDPILPEPFGPFRLEQHALLYNIWLRAADVVAAPAPAFTLATETSFLKSRRVSYDGIVSVRCGLVAEKVIPAWPVVGNACVCSILGHIDPYLADLIADPKKCLLPHEDWPSETPVSRVHADTDEWISIVRAGVERGMFAGVDEADIFTNQLGAPVLNGAMGVDKVREEGGVVTPLLCFISILTPLNQYMNKIGGDEHTLPQAAFLSRLILSDNEFIVVGGEDFQSCLNLFRLSKAWLGHMAFEKRVPARLLERNSDKLVLVGLQMAPMRWALSVGLIQNVLRRFVFRSCMADPNLEVRPNVPFPEGDAVVTCMDGFGRITKVFTASEFERAEKCPDMVTFTQLAEEIGLPLNVSKRVICSVNSAILGSELDRVAGLLRHRRNKTHSLLGRSLALLAMLAVCQAAVQHWCGLCCFAAGFQRPLFAALQDIFPSISSFEDSHFQNLLLPKSVHDEFLLSAVLLSFAGTDLGAPLRLSMSISDASENRGGAAEADKLTRDFCSDNSSKVQQYYSRLNEDAVGLAGKRPSIMCVICVLRFEPRFPVWCACGPGCFARTCPRECFQKYKASRCKVPIGGHVQMFF